MRIGMMADVYKPHVSGVTNYIALNKAHLEKLGHQVYVFTFSAGDYLDDEPNVIRSPGLPLLDTGYYFSLRYTRTARRLLQTMDVVHVHHPFLSGTLALLYCRPRGIPIIFTNHTRYDLYAQAYLPIVPDVIGHAALQSYMPAFCRACDLVVSPSPGMRDVLLQFGVDVPIDIVPNGVDLEPFQNPGNPIQRAELGLRQEDIVLIFVGRLGPEKNLAFLLRSFAGAVQAYENLRLVLIGAGPEQENLEDRAQRSGIQHAVRFLGAIPYDQLPRYLAMADAFVTASVTEVHPLTVIEAMAAGLRAANSIDQYLREGRVELSEDERMSRVLKNMGAFESETVDRLGGQDRVRPAERPTGERVTDFEEVEQVITPEEALMEADRCLRCYRIILLATER